MLTNIIPRKNGTIALPIANAQSQIRFCGIGLFLRNSKETLAHNESERDQLVRTIGPVWDANEVWLITAGGAMFASFPYWYASLFSGYYLILMIILAGLIMKSPIYHKNHLFSFQKSPICAEITHFPEHF